MKQAILEELLAAVEKQQLEYDKREKQRLEYNKRIRNWRKANPEKAALHQARYWNKKVQEINKLKVVK